MFAYDIGMNQIEEVNIVRNGENYGWMKREGFWENGMIRPGGALDQLFTLPAEILDGRKKDEFTYPVAIYDHDEGQAVQEALRITVASPRCATNSCSATSSADVCSRPILPRLKKADDGVPQTVAPVEEIQLYVRDAEGNRTDVSLRRWWSEGDGNRA